MQHTLWFLLIFRRIHIELPHQHAIGGLGVLVGAVGLEIVFHLASAVEFIGGGEVSAFHLVEDGLCVDESAFREVEINACTQKFLGQEWHVEVVRVEAGEVAACKCLAQLGSQFLEGLGLGHLLVADTRERGHLLRNSTLGVYEEISALLATVGKHFDIGNLNDSVLHKVKPRRLQIEDDKGLIKV